MRRIVPTTVMLALPARRVITDLRYANWCLPHVPPADAAGGGPFVAPEIRDGAVGEPASDVYTVCALVYHALTGQEPDPEPEKILPPSRARPAVPAALERVILRALAPRPADRY